MRRPPNYNLVVDLLKVETFKTFLKQAMFLSKAVKYQGLLSKSFLSSASGHLFWR